MRERSLPSTATLLRRGLVKRMSAMLAGVACLVTLTACASGTTDTNSADGVAPAACDPTLDLASTAFGPYTALNQIPTVPPAGTDNPSGFWGGSPPFLATITDNNFDPCAELSWVTLSGSTQHDPGNTVGADSAAVLLFHRDQLLTDPLPSQLAANPQVERISGNEIQVAFTSYVPAGGAATGQPQRVAFSWEDGALHTDEIDLIRDYSQTVTELDLLAAPPNTDVTVLPLGNVHGRPFDTEYELAEYPGSNVRIRLDGDSELLCILDFAERHQNWGWIGCAGYGVDWPFLEPPFGGPTTANPAPVDPDVAANYLQIALMPTILASTHFDDATMPDFPVAHTIEDGALTRVGHYVIDTRGQHPRLIYGGTAVEIREDGFDTAPANLLDRGRWTH